MLQLSDDAVGALRETGPIRLTGHETDGGVDIEVEEVDGPAEGDKVVERDGASVYLDAAASDALADQVLEVEPHDDHVHFDFSPQP